MTHWDGLASSTSSGTSTPQRICILGATNRIQDIDEAILRRMPKKFGRIALCRSLGKVRIEHVYSTTFFWMTLVMYMD